MFFVTEMIASINQDGELDRAGCLSLKRFRTYPDARRYIQEWYNIASDRSMPTFEVLDYNNDDYLRTVEHAAYSGEDWYHIFNIVRNS